MGTIWSSTIFPKQAPEGYEAFTTFIGGSRNPELMDICNNRQSFLSFYKIRLDNKLWKGYLWKNLN
ncbi:MAG: hypothetical protein QME25_07495 [Bacteroidota bacterium]|nr:hypothetical protein [Bacteroidota bacterium]